MANDTEAAISGTNPPENQSATTTEPRRICTETEQRIERVPTSRLKPHPRNARIHSRKQIRQIAESIRRFGFCNPVLVDDANQIVAGHGRVEAAKVLGLVDVPTLRLSHMSEDEVRAYIIADNKLAEQAGWDREVLAVELEYLVSLDIDVEAIGFEVGEIDLTLTDADEARSEASGPEDQLPDLDPVNVVSRPGDIWVLGNHRLLCGDARDGAAYDLLLGGDRASLIFTDPPFNVAISGHASRSVQKRDREFAMAVGEMTPQDFIDFQISVFRHLAAYSEDGSIHFVCMDWRHMGELLAAGHKVYAELLNVCVWAKTHFGMGSFYRSQHELVFVWKAGEAPHLNNLPHRSGGRSRSNVWQYPNVVRAGQSEEYGFHPTVKPVQLVADAIKDCSKRNGIVLDPFVGSGTAVIAAERTGRRARAMDIDPRYVDVCVRRWQSYTGKAATLAGTGHSFGEIELERVTASTSAVDEPEAQTKEAA